MAGLKRVFFAIGRPVKVTIDNWTLLKGFLGRDVKGRFAGTMAGMAWSMLNPLATIMVYMFVFSLVLRVEVTIEETGTNSFFIYFITGFVPWMIFSDSIMRSTSSLLDNASLITKVVFPVELIPITSVLSGLIVNGLGMLALFVYLFYMDFFSLSWMFLPLAFVLQVIFTCGLAMLLSSVCVFFRDLRELMNILMMIWFFSTPVIYPLSLVPDNIRSLIEYNPMYFFVSVYRGLLIQEDVDLWLLGGAALVALLAFAAGSLFFARVKPGFGDVL